MFFCHGEDFAKHAFGKQMQKISAVPPEPWS